MGQFAVVITGTGNHGCSREQKDGEHVLGCQRPDCVDCIAREVVRRLKRNGVQQLVARLVHWPEVEVSDDVPQLIKLTESSVVDDLVSGVRSGSF